MSANRAVLPAGETDPTSDATTESRRGYDTTFDNSEFIGRPACNGRDTPSHQQYPARIRGKSRKCVLLNLILRQRQNFN